MYVGKKNPGRYYINDNNDVYTDKLAELACACNDATGGKVMARLEQLFESIYIDEVQDLAGYDLEFLELLLKSKVSVTVVGDLRQATYSTNNPKKNTQFIGAKIIGKFEVWKQAGLLEIDSLNHSHRCNQKICDLGDSLYPHLPKTTSKQTQVTGHDGIFAVSTKEVLSYYHQYNPKVLRTDKRTNTLELPATNFGYSKGLSFDRILIFPTGRMKKWLSSGDYSHVCDSDIALARLYVAITRAKFSVAFVYDGKKLDLPGIERL